MQVIFGHKTATGQYVKWKEGQSNIPNQIYYCHLTSYVGKNGGSYHGNSFQSKTTIELCSLSCDVSELAFTLNSGNSTSFVFVVCIQTASNAQIWMLELWTGYLRQTLFKSSMMKEFHL